MDRENRVRMMADKLMRLDLSTVQVWHDIFKMILDEAVEKEDPRIDNPGGVREQYDALKIVLENKTRPPDQVVGMKSITLSGKIGK